VLVLFIRMARRGVGPACVRIATFVSSIAKGRAFLTTFLLHQPTHGNAERNIIDSTEVAQSHLPVSIEQHETRRALQSPTGHGLGNRATGTGFIHADRETQSVLVDEGSERIRAHHAVVLEYCMQPDDSNLVFGESVTQPHGLRQPVRDATWTQHLEGENRDHSTPQRIELNRLGGIEPLADMQLRARWILHSQGAKWSATAGNC